MRWRGILLLKRSSNFYVLECPGIRHCLALGRIRWSDYHYLPVVSAIVATNSKTNHRGLLSLSDPLPCLYGDDHPWNSILDLLVAIEKEVNFSDRCLKSGKADVEELAKFS